MDFAVHPDFLHRIGCKAPEKANRVLDAITQRARFIAYQGIMFYCIEDWKEFEKRSPEDPILEHIATLRRALGSRLVIVNAEYKVTNEHPDVHGPVFGAARDQARRQGHTFTPDATAYAYGLTSTVCVPLTARAARQYFGFQDRVRAVLGLTDFDPEEQGQGFEDIEAGFSKHVAFQHLRHRER